MADAATLVAPTGDAPAPAATSPVPSSAETTLGPQVERGQAPAPTDPTPAAQTPETPPAAPRPKLADLLKDPEYAREHEGITGERIRRERAAAEAAVAERLQQNQAAQYQQWERQQIANENQLRAQEAAELARLLAAGDPYEHYQRATQVAARQAEVNQRWQANQAQRQAAFQVQQQVSQAAAAEAAKIKAGLDAHFRSLPREVQTVLSERQYHGGIDEILGEWSNLHAQHIEMQQDAKTARQVEAGVKKALAQMNLNAEDFDLGGGRPVSGSPYRYMNDVEAAFRKGDLSPAEVRNYRNQGLPYRGRQ